MGHLQQAADARNTKKIHKVILHPKRLKLRSKSRMEDDVEHDTREMGIVNWRQLAQDGKRWRGATGGTLILLE